MSDDPKRTRPSFKRRRYFIDARLQLSLALPLLGVLAIVALAYAAAIYLLPGKMALETMTAEETRALFLRANLVYFAIAAVLLGAVAIFLAHRIAGPAQVIEAALRGLLRGRYDQRLALRPGDSLTSLAAAVNELRAQLRERDERQERLLRELEACLAANDLAAARALLAELTGTEAPRASAPSRDVRRAGFTIIELMMVVGLIGILTTLAIPTMLRFQLRTKAAEGRTNIAAIVKAEAAYYAEFNSYVSANPPQPATIGQQKTSWPLTASAAHGFNTMGFAPEGQLYFQYAVASDLKSFTIGARSDIDGNGAYNTWGYVKPAPNDASAVLGPFGTCPATGVIDPVNQVADRVELIGPCNPQSGNSVY
jgi:prepilin-type N-terminal cleavage/methylation domain-containing protein